MFENLQNPGAFGLGAMQSFQQGRELRRADDGRKAMTAYATDPSDTNLNGLAAYQPEFVMQQRERQDAAKRQQAAEQAKAQERMLIGDALTATDPAKRAGARQQLAYVNHEEYRKLGDDDKAKVDESMKGVAQQAFTILQMPEEQQGPALQQALQAMSAQGMDVSQIDLSQGPKATLMSALALTGNLDDWEQFSKPSYMPVGERGLAGFQFGQPIQQGGKAQDFTPDSSGIPEGAVADLKANPKTAAQFDEIFGQGAAARVLGGSASNGGATFP